MQSSSNDKRDATRRRLEAARIAAIRAHAEAVPPTPEYLAAKSAMQAKRKARQ